MRSLHGIDNKCIISNCLPLRSIRRTNIFNVIQSKCIVKSLLENINNVQLKIPSRSEVLSENVNIVTTTPTIGLQIESNKYDVVSATEPKNIKAVPALDTMVLVDGSLTSTDSIESNKTIIHIKQIKPFDLEGQCESNEKVQLIDGHPKGMTSTTKSHHKTNEKIPNDVKNYVIRKSIDCLLADLTDTTKMDQNELSGAKIEYEPGNRQKVMKTHREGVRMNFTALKRERHIKSRFQKKLS